MRDAVSVDRARRSMTDGANDGGVSLAGSGRESDEDSVLLWILVWSELVAFGVLFTALLIFALLHPREAAFARLHLSSGLAACNTLVLLTSGWQAAAALRPNAGTARTRLHLVFAACGGMVFVAVKIWEYVGEAAAASDPSAGDFFEIYFLMTGFHLIHVAFGSILLLIVAAKPSRSNITLVTTLWHVVDLIWIVMFPLLYLG